MGSDELRAVVLPYLLAHATLGHRGRRPRLEELKERQQEILAANHRAVEIMVRFMGMTEREAVERFASYFAKVNDEMRKADRVPYYNRLGPYLPFGHPHPCDQLRDLWLHFGMAEPQPKCER